MRTRLLGIVGVAAVLLTGAVFSASAMPAGNAVAPSDAILQFFASHGIDTQYVGMSQDKVPADVWAKIVALQSDPDLVTLVQANLRDSFNFDGHLLYEQVGDVYYEAEASMNQKGAPSFNWEGIG